MEALLLFVLFFLLLAFLAVSKQKQRPSNYPPGPRGLPFLGYAPFLRPRQFVAFQRLSRRFGAIFSVKMAWVDMVVLNSYAAVKEAFVQQADVFAGRPYSAYSSFLTEDTGVVFVDGQMWRDHRRFALKTLRDFGLGRSTSLNIVLSEIGSLRANLEAASGRPVHAMDFLMQHTSNVISNLAFGARTAAEDPECWRLLRRFDAFSKKDGSFLNTLPFILPVIVKFGPALRLFEFFVGRKQLIDDFTGYIKRKLAEHEARLESSEPEDFLDAIILHRRQLDDAAQPHNFSDTAIAETVLELFFAGTDTTAVSLNWACVFMALHPSIQERVQQEIRQAIGPDRLPTMQDRKHLPLTCAVLDETARFASVAPGGLLHRTLSDTRLCDFDIPANTWIYPNLFAVHRDAQLWKTPDAFDPHNFLDQDGAYRPSEHLIPFSLGRRACLGESLARMEFFLFFVAIMQRFSVRLEGPVDLEQLLLGTASLVHRPGEHKVVFEKLDIEP